MISNSSGKVAVSDVTSTELGYLDGVTSNVQTQLGAKAPTSHASTATTYGQATASNYGHVKLSDTYTSKTTNGAAANGLGASQNALYNAYNALNTSKQANLSWTPTASNSASAMTLTTANTYYKVGSNGLSFSSGGKYIMVIHVQAQFTGSTNKDATLTFAVGTSASDTTSALRKITVKNAAQTTANQYVHWTDIISFSADTTYYGWVASNYASSPVTIGWWADCLKFA